MKHITIGVIIVACLNLLTAGTACAKEHNLSETDSAAGPVSDLEYGPNLLADPGFENVSSPGLKENLVRTMPRGGSHSLRFSLTREEAQAGESRITTLDPVTVEPNSLYKVEAWVHVPQDITTPHAARSALKQPGTRSFYGAFLRGDLLNAEGAGTGEALLGTSRRKPHQQIDLAHHSYGGWIQLRGLVKTAGDTRSLRLHLGLEQDTGTVFFDDLSVRQIANPNDFLRMFETPEARDKRIGWWRESGYGMFPIFGIYSVHAGVWNGRYWPDQYAEWLTHRAGVSHGELRALAETFRPHAFDAKEFVRLAREAGMGHIVITAKYHDGFAMWPTKCDQFNLRDCSRFDRDVLGELAEACKEAGIHLGFYYSQGQEWYTPGGFDTKRRHAFGEYPPEAQTWEHRSRLSEPDIAPLDLTRNYLENKCKPQLVELMDRYEPKIIWFDYPGEINIIDSLELLAIIRKRNPACLAGSRLHVSGELRDFKTLGDYSVPAGEIGETYWESLPGLQKHTYSYDQFQPFRPAKEIFKELKSVKDKGGNYLLAIGGPKGDGSIPEANFQILREVKRLADEAGLKLVPRTNESR